MSKDKIIEKIDGVHHESAGGFLFYKDPVEGLLVALIKKVDGSYWMPKGHLEIGESPGEAAERELTEELALKVKPRLISKVGIISYEFSLPNDKRKHFKDVHIFLFVTDKKVEIANQTMQTIKGERGRFDQPEWLKTNCALEKIEFDREILKKSVDLFLSLKTANSV